MCPGGERAAAKWVRAVVEAAVSVPAKAPYRRSVFMVNGNIVARGRAGGFAVPQSAVSALAE